MTDASNAAAARSQALANCNRQTNGLNDCSVAVEFSDHRCAAIMENRGQRSYAWGRGNSIAEAESDALNKLSNGGTVMVARCNASSGTSSFVPEPIRAQSDIIGNDTSPIAINNSSIKSQSDRTYTQCLSWRNVSNKEISAIKFDFHFYDEFNASQVGFTSTSDGKFSPGVKIDDICWHGSLWTPQQIRQLRVEKIKVLSVKFNDDSIWTPGTAWTKTFLTSGTALSAPQVVTGSVSSDGSSIGGATPISVGGAVGGGGSLGPTGAFGAIAMQTGTHVVGSSIDATTEDASIYDAMSKCNQQTAGVNNCAIMVKFSGSNKCAALAADGIHYGTGKGPELNNVIATALANLRANGGNIGNNILASPCNSR